MLSECSYKLSTVYIDVIAENKRNSTSIYVALRRTFAEKQTEKIENNICCYLNLLLVKFGSKLPWPWPSTGRQCFYTPDGDSDIVMLVH